MKQFKKSRHKKNYDKKMKRINEIKSYHNRLHLGSIAQDNEAIGVLKRQFLKGQITCDEYNERIKKYESSSNN